MVKSIELLEKEIFEKDNQIFEKDNQIKELNQQLIDMNLYGLKLLNENQLLKVKLNKYEKNT